MPEILNPTVALSLIRKLSNTENYPFHPEGEGNLADTLVNHCDGPTHAQYVIEEFDESETCPTVAALRAAAARLAELCRCGKPKWAHRDKSACARFDQLPTEEEQWHRTAQGFAKVHDAVPMIPGVPWEVALQVETIRIDLGQRALPPDHARLKVDGGRYPEVVAALQAGRTPDYASLESQMRALFPHMWKREKRMAAATVVDRLGLIDKTYAVESIDVESPKE